MNVSPCEGCEVVAEPRATGYREPPPCESCTDYRGRLVEAENEYVRMSTEAHAARIELTDLRSESLLRYLVAGTWKALVFAGGVGAIHCMVSAQISRNEIEAADARAVKAAVAAVEAAKPPAPCVDTIYAVGGWSGATMVTCDSRAVASIEGSVGKCTCAREKP